jgi:hypothetical protein
MKEKNADTYLSADIVACLRKRGMTLKSIGQASGNSESFICRVSKGQRAFTLRHLATLERKLGIPLPQLLLESVNGSSIPAEMRHLYHRMRQMMKARPPETHRRTRHSLAVA